MNEEQSFINGLNQVNWSTGELPSGVYILKVSGQEGSTATRLVINK
jgi:hypothetical protein